jgi:hypothetical protein
MTVQHHRPGFITRTLQGKKTLPLFEPIGRAVMGQAQSCFTRRKPNPKFQRIEPYSYEVARFIPRNSRSIRNKIVNLRQSKVLACSTEITVRIRATAL